MVERIKLNGKHQLPVPVEGRVMLLDSVVDAEARNTPANRKYAKRRLAAALNAELDRVINRKTGIKNIHVFAASCVANGMYDASFARIVFDHVDGPPANKLEVTGADGEPIKQINLNMSLQEAAEVYRQMLKREIDNS